MIGLPWLGASASLTLRGITVEKTWAPRKSRRSDTTWFERLVRSSYIVNRKPSIVRLWLRFRRILTNVSQSSVTPSRAKYSHWIGTRTEFAADKALRVSRPRLGGQSINT